MSAELRGFLMGLTWGLVVLIQGITIFDTGYRFLGFDDCVNAKAEARFEVNAREVIPQLEEKLINSALVCIPMKQKG